MDLVVLVEVVPDDAGDDLEALQLVSSSDRDEKTYSGADDLANAQDNRDETREERHGDMRIY